MTDAHDHDDLDEDASMPPDPDRHDVPADLLELDGRQVKDSDGNVSIVVVVPGLFGHARRFREGFHDDPDGAA